MKSLLLALLVFAPLQANGQDASHEWVIAAVSVANDTFYVDRAGIHRVGETRNVWMEVRLATAGTASSGAWFNRTMAYVSFQCSEPKYNIQALFLYAGRLLVESHETLPKEYAIYSPGSSYEQVALVVCSGKSR